MSQDRTWSIKEALDWTRDYLASRGDEHPRRSAEWLLSHATGLSRVELYAYFDRPLSPQERAVLRELVARRGTGEPLQYVCGEVAFRHLILKVSAGVLIPRPETEVLVGLVLDRIADTDSPLVIDACTGSGCIGLSIVHEHPTARVIATEVSPAAATVATANAERLGYADRFEVRTGNLLDPVTPADGRAAVVVSNPPYVPSAEIPTLSAEVAGFEPHLALDGGADGLDLYRDLVTDAPRLLSAGGWLAVELHETNSTQAARIAVELEPYGEVSVERDLAGRERFVLAQYQFPST